MNAIAALIAEIEARLAQLTADYPDAKVHVAAGVLAWTGMSSFANWQVSIGEDAGEGSAFEEAREKAARRHADTLAAELRKAAPA